DPTVEVLLSEGAGALPSPVADPRERYVTALKSGVGVEVGRAIQLIQSGRAKDGARHLRFVLQFEKDDPAIWTNLATALWNTGEFDEAIAAVDRATTLDPENYRYHLVKAEILIAAGDAAKAGKSENPLQQSSAKAPDPERAKELYSGARSAADLAIRFAPRDEWRPYFARGKAASRLGDRLEARDALNTARTLNRENSEVCMWLFEVCWQLNDRKLATEALEDAVALAPKNLIAWVNLVHVRIEAKNWDGARQALDRAAAIDPTHERVVKAREKLEQLRPPTTSGTESP
ncbi:MAG: tetratricopeptide repeat protein, partial [Planctomycetes bacterium]|nr:tetratricopeptide repeat protein [Planctomycetota bacterium]